MPKVLQVSLEELLQRYDGALTSLDEFQHHRADAHLLADNARCSLWWKNVPEFPNQKLGLIGHFESRTEQSARGLLIAACTELKSHSCTLAIAPIDGSTWNRYRLVTEAGAEPPFFLEPQNPQHYPSYFTTSGFTPLATYCSALNTNLSHDDPKNQIIRKKIADLGITLRPLNPGDFDNELKRIYNISLIAFRKNFLYTPIDENDFRNQYAKIRPILRPELILIAEQNSRPIGFMFALPDLLSQKRNGPPTVLLKTLAVLPDRSHAGLGGLLISECQKSAHQLGFTRSIFALMHDANPSRSISSRYGQIMRRYTLYSKPL